MPSQIIFMESLPLTVSGKIDRKRLPEPQKRFSNSKMLTRPKTFYENELFSLWRAKKEQVRLIVRKALQAWQKDQTFKEAQQSYFG